MSAPRVATARQKLELSSLRPTQLEAMGDDVDLNKLYLALATNHNNFNILDAVTDVRLQRTIQGASTVTVNVIDRDRTLLRSGRLSARNDIEIDGLFFRLKSIEKTGGHLDLMFEDREVAILRTYNRPIKQSLSTSRQKVTRAEFVLRMLREVKEFKIPYIIPELHRTQVIAGQKQLPTQQERTAGRSFGIPRKNDLNVKGVAMTEEQRRNAEAVLDTGTSMVLPRKLLVMAIMCVIQESTLYNLLPAKDSRTAFQADSVGLFQQRKSMGWPATRDIPTDAHEFFKRLANRVQQHPNEQYYASIQAVQISGFPMAYAQWRTEAERIVTAYGVVPSTAAESNLQWKPDASGGDYEFYRGIPPTTQKADWGRESSWDCIQRLANEVNWRAFFVSGTFYFLPDEDLLKSQPIAVIDEDTEGILSIDGPYDEGAKSANLTVSCRASRWAAPPGSVVQVENMGPYNGRWIVNDISRSLFDPMTEITLKKKLPRLPEPSGSNIAADPASATYTWAGPQPSSTEGQRGTQFRTPGAFVQPIPRGHNSKIIQGRHETAGLAGFPAADFGADAGAPVLAVESGTIYKLSGHDPNTGPSDPFLGIHGPFGWSCYLRGDSGSEYYYTHLGTRNVVMGEKVTAGEQIGTVGNYARWGGANHVHVGVHQVGKGPSIEDLMSSPQAVKG